MCVFWLIQVRKDDFLIFWKERKCILDQKIVVLKSAKNRDFPKGVSPWLLSKIQTFSYQCFLQKLCERICFFDILDRKEEFLFQKIEVFKGPKNGHFRHGFCSKLELFLICFLQKFSENIVFNIPDGRKTVFRAKKLKYLKLQKIEIFLRL